MKATSLSLLLIGMAYCQIRDTMVVDSITGFHYYLTEIQLEQFVEGHKYYNSISTIQLYTCKPLEFVNLGPRDRMGRRSGVFVYYDDGYLLTERVLQCKGAWEDHGWDKGRIRGWKEGFIAAGILTSVYICGKLLANNVQR